MDIKRTRFDEFDSHGGEYSDFVHGDPVRNYLHYPSVIAEMGDIRNRRILDVGCGDGLFARKLAKEYGAKVIGYDRGEDLIKIARQTAVSQGVDARFEVADARSFHASEPVDFATSVMVLPYAPSEQDLEEYFASTQRALSMGGKFVSIVFNPRFQGQGDIIPNRIFKFVPGQKIEVQFLDPQTKAVRLTGELNQFSKEVYDDAAHKAGFNKTIWRPVHPTQEGEKKLGREFWHQLEASQPYSLLIAEK